MFIDYERTFDTVIRGSPWIKLLQSGISCKMVKMIKSIYNDVKCCVKLSSDMSVPEVFQAINDLLTSIDMNTMVDSGLNLIS